MNAFFKKHFGSRSVRAGGYAAVASAIVVAIAIAVNLLVSALPETVTHPDFTENQLYTLSDQTKRITNALERDVTLSLIASSGSERAAPTTGSIQRSTGRETLKSSGSMTA